jgi:hypothetical protein
MELGGTVWNGDCLLETLACLWLYQHPAQPPEWAGFFLVPADHPFGTGGRYRLVLDDGRAGEIVVQAAVPASGGGSAIHFAGRGSLPPPGESGTGDSAR